MRCREEFAIHNHFKSLLTHRHGTAQSKAANIGCCDTWDLESLEGLRWRFVRFLVFPSLFFWFISLTMGAVGAEEEQGVVVKW